MVRRAVEADVVRLAGGVVFRRLSPGLSRDVDFFESTYPPGSTGAEQNELVTHLGYEIGTVTRGELTIDFPDERVVLRARRHHLLRLRDPPPAVQPVRPTRRTWVIVHPVADRAPDDGVTRGPAPSVVTPAANTGSPGTTPPLASNNAARRPPVRQPGDRWARSS